MKETELTEALQLSVLSFSVFDHKKMKAGKLIKIYIYPELKKKKLKERQSTKTTLIIRNFESK